MTKQLRVLFHPSSPQLLALFETSLYYTRPLPVVPLPPFSLLPHRSHLQRKTWGPGAAASGGICRSPARRRARPGGGAGSAPPPRRLPTPSFPFLRPRAPSSLLHPSPTLFVCPSRCDWLGGLAAPAPIGRRGRQPRRPPEAAEGSEIRGPEAALHLVRARGGCLCTPSRGPRGLASSRGGGGKGESRARCGTAPGEKAGRTPAAASSPCFSPTALWRPGRLPDRGGLDPHRGDMESLPQPRLQKPVSFQ